MKKLLIACSVMVISAVSASAAGAQTNFTVQARGAGSVEVFVDELICLEPDFCFIAFRATGETAHFGFNLPPANFIFAGNAIVPFRLTAHVQETSEKIEMELAFVAPDSFQAGFQFVGACRINNEPGQCSGRVHDRGEPGSEDIFQMQWNKTLPFGGPGLMQGFLLSGNIDVTITTAVAPGQ